jgi:DNA replication protein DnaC
MLQQSYSKEGGTRQYEIEQELCTVPMLVIDEIGRTKGGRWEEEWMSYVVNKRHENLRPLILMSNKHLKEDCPSKGCPDCLQNWIGNDILSRIIEDGLVMEFTGEDYREKIRRAGAAGEKNA